MYSGQCYCILWTSRLEGISYKMIIIAVARYLPFSLHLVTLLPVDCGEEGDKINLTTPSHNQLSSQTVVWYDINKR